MEGDADCHLQFHPPRVAAGFLFPGVCPLYCILWICRLRRHTNPDRYLNKNYATFGDSQDSLPEMIPETLESAVNASSSAVSCVSTIEGKYTLQLSVVPEAMNSYLRTQRGWVSFLLPKAGCGHFTQTQRMFESKNDVLLRLKENMLMTFAESVQGKAFLKRMCLKA